MLAIYCAVLRVRFEADGFVSKAWIYKIILIVMAFILCGMTLPKSWLLDGLSVNSHLVKSDAIILMAGGFKSRVPVAAKLYRDGYAPLVVLTNDGVIGGWSPKHNRNLYQVEWAEDELNKLGVPNSNIVKLPYYGSATIFDALAVKRYLLTAGLKKIIVVTSDYHTRRSLWTFKKTLQKYAIDVSVFSARTFWIGRRWIMLEYTKLGYYMIRYGVFNLIPEQIERPMERAR